MYERIAVYKWWNQAVKAAQQNAYQTGMEAREPVVHIKQKRGDPLVLIDEVFFFDLIGSYYVNR